MLVRDVAVETVLQQQLQYVLNKIEVVALLGVTIEGKVLADCENEYMQWSKVLSV